MSNKILWHKWVNPLTGAGAEEDVSLKLDEEMTGEYKDSYDEMEDHIRTLRRPSPYRPTMGQVIASPVGYIPIDEHGDPGVIYDFWMMHTNFNISPKVADTVTAIPGVESWNIHSRYRARVGFARLFNRAEVMKAIQDALGCNDKAITVNEPDCRNITLERLKKRLSSTAPAWAILDYDGQFRTIRGDENHVRQNVENLKALPNPPVITTSWEK